ncbi:MAG: hypothetical protein KDB94_08925 [Acidobacteria bacterium]|nr:hypothetical protein [Acidobacteriota bacterium]
MAFQQIEDLFVQPTRCRLTGTPTTHQQDQPFDLGGAIATLRAFVQVTTDRLDDRLAPAPVDPEEDGSSDSLTAHRRRPRRSRFA